MPPATLLKPAVLGLGLAAALATTASRAAPVQCPEGQGVYRAVSGPPHELIFQGTKGVLALAKGLSRVRYPFEVTASNGFSRTYVTVPGKGAPSSVAMGFNPDFTAYRGEGSASYLVTPDLPVGFHYWEPFRSRADAYDLLPGDAWQLVRCSNPQR